MKKKSIICMAGILFNVLSFALADAATMGFYNYINGDPATSVAYSLSYSSSNIAEVNPSGNEIGINTSGSAPGGSISTMQTLGALPLNFSFKNFGFYSYSQVTLYIYGSLSFALGQGNFAHQTVTCPDVALFQIDDEQDLPVYPWFIAQYGNVIVGKNLLFRNSQGPINLEDCTVSGGGAVQVTIYQTLGSDNAFGIYLN